MKMKILHRDDDITHIALIGRLDTPGAEEISQAFADATVARDRPAMIDLSQTEFLASRGIALLLANGKKLIQAGHKLMILNPQEMVESVLMTGRVDKVLPISHNLDEAIEILQGTAATPGPSVTRAETSGDDSCSARPEPARPVATVSEGELTLSIKNELSELEGLTATLTQFLDAHGVTHRAAYAVNLAIDELVVNVMRYAYVDDDTHFIDIELAIEREQIILTIVDDGRPFDPRRGPSLDLHAEDREVGGLGLILVLDMVDVLNYRRVDETNRVEVRVHMTAEDETSDPPTGEP